MKRLQVDPITKHLMIHPCFYICIIDVKHLPEDDQDRSKYVDRLCVKNIILTSVHFLVLLHELFVSAWA